MLGAVKDLLNSEKAVASGVLSILSTILVALGHMTTDQWVDLNKWVLTVYVAGKTVASGVAALADRKTTQTKVTEETKVDAQIIETAKRDEGGLPQ